MADMKKDYYQEVTNEIIKAIEEGTTPWQQGWDSKVGAAIAAVPINGKTGRPYYKDNLIRLSIVMRRHGNSKDPRFFTVKQAKDIGNILRRAAFDGHFNIKVDNVFSVFFIVTNIGRMMIQPKINTITINPRI